MVPDKITNVDPTGQPQPPDRSPNAVSNDPAFRRMLERLEELARQGKSTPAADVSEADTGNTEEFMDAMKKADDDFVAAMDLRRKLEEAYRRSQP
jgi:flagellar hook-basal body complex protein FliE